MSRLSQSLTQTLIGFGLMAIFALGVAVSSWAEETAPAQSPYLACSGKNLVQAQGSAREALKALSAENSCFQADDLVPGTGLFKFGFSELAEWNRAAEFSLKVGSRHEEDLARNLEKMKGVKACLQAQKSWNDQPAPECDARIKFFKEHFIPESKRARIHLALAISPADAPPVIVPGSKDKYLNIALTAPDFFPLVGKREPLTSDELREVRSNFDQILGKIKNAYGDAVTKSLSQRDSESRESVADIELKKRVQAFNRATASEAYLDTWPNWRTFQSKALREMHSYEQGQLLRILNRYPGIAYVRSFDPSPAEMVGVMDQIIANNQAESARNSRAMASISASAPDSLSEMFELTAYPGLVEETLLKNPQDCAIATALALHKENREGRQMMLAAVAMGGILVAPFVLPVAVTAGGTLGLSAYAIYDADQVFQQKLAEAAAYPTETNANLTATMSDAYRADQDLKLSWISLPLGLVSNPLLQRLPRALASPLR